SAPARLRGSVRSFRAMSSTSPLKALARCRTPSWPSRRTDAGGRPMRSSLRSVRIARPGATLGSTTSTTARTSYRQVATVDKQRFSSYVGGHVGSEKHDGIRYILDIGEAVHRKFCKHLLPDVGSQLSSGHCRFNQSWRHGVHVDPVRGELACKSLCERDHTRLRGAVQNVAEYASCTGGRH